MAILNFIIGAIIGFLFKLLFDWYHEFVITQTRTKSELDELIAISKGIVYAKEKEYKKFTTEDEKNKLI